MNKSYNEYIRLNRNQADMILYLFEKRLDKLHNDGSLFGNEWELTLYNELLAKYIKTYGTIPNVKIYSKIKESKEQENSQNTIE